MKLSKIIAIWLCISLAFSLAIAKTDAEKLDDLLESMGITYDVLMVPEMEVWGTEYISGEQGKIWLQLLDAESQPINDSTCFITTWFPNNTVMFNESPMYYLDEGIHSKDFIVPNIDGVYPQTALCSVPELVANLSDYYVVKAYDNLESGTGSGGTGWITDWGFDDDLYCDVSTLTSPIGSYHIRCAGNDGKALRISDPSPDVMYNGHANISFWASFSSLESAEFYYFEFFNGTDWEIKKSWTNGDDDGIYKYYRFEIISCRSAIMFRFRADTSGTGDYGTFDNITVWTPELYGYYEMNSTEYQYVFGSGEIHVSSGLSNDIQDLWRYMIIQDSRNLQSNHDYCYDNTTLLKVLTYSTMVNGELIEVQQNQTIPCEFGCFKYFNTADSQGECAPNPIPRFIFYIIAVLVIMAIVGSIYMSKMI